MRPQRSISILALLGAVTATGCSSQSSSSGVLGEEGGGDASLSIEVRRGPLRPVTRVGQDDTAPVEGAVIVVRDAQGKEMASLTSDAAGMAEVNLAPGQYRVETEECPGATAPAPPQTVTLADGKPATARLECDTGIR